MMMRVNLAAEVRDDVASLINFNNVIELRINDQVDGFLQCSAMHFQSQVATLHRSKCPPARKSGLAPNGNSA